VADFSALEGTLDDDSATSTVKISVPLVGDQVACPICERREVNLLFMNLSDLGRHLDQHHIGACIQWRCLYCERSFPKLHGARCHLPKCSGTSQNSNRPHKCEACPMSFGTQRGLSTQERHAHPAVRNLKRRGTDHPNTKIWTVDEVALLRELEETYKDERFPNVEISKILTTKSIDQIKYKRKKLKLISGDEDPQGVTQETEGGCDPVDSGNAHTQSPEYSGSNEESIQQWRLLLTKEIEKPTEVPPALREVNNRLDKIWNDYRGNEEATEEVISRMPKKVGRSIFRERSRIPRTT
jgi:hypothetical protein